MGSCANMIKGLSWMAGGSTRSVFNLSFVRDNNIAGAYASMLHMYWHAVRTEHCYMRHVLPNCRYSNVAGQPSSDTQTTSL
jgi:hypothetical protein